MSADASGETPRDQGGADDAARPLGSIRGEGQRATRLTEALKRYIVVNRLPPGTRLPPERQLATALMAGRNAVREALHSLAILGIVEKRQGSGVYVRDFDGERLAQMVIGEDFRYVSSMRLDRALLGDRDTIRNHEPLLEALAARDPAASVDAMRYHFRQLRGFIDELVATASGKPAGRGA